jgi:hypothetical protein
LRLRGRKQQEIGELHNEKLHDLHSSPNIMIIKSRKLRWAEKRIKMHIGFWWEQLKRKLGRTTHRWEGNI